MSDKKLIEQKDLEVIPAPFEVLGDEEYRRNFIPSADITTKVISKKFWSDHGDGVWKEVIER